ncbi:MAG: peptide deformylase [Pseudomonadota bacterium]
MSVLPLIIAPDQILRKKSLPVEVFDEALRSFIKNMIETMYHDRGIGLAAVQVGVHKRILIIDLKEDDDNPDRPADFFPLVVINPEIVQISEAECTATEGCLSVPGQYLDVIRPESVTVKYKDGYGKEHMIECKDWFARCMLHEIDHLDGKLLIDYVSNLKRDVILRKLTRAKRQNAI